MTPIGPPPKFLAKQAQKNLKIPQEHILVWGWAMLGHCSQFWAIYRERRLNANFFSQTFRAPPGCPGKIPGYPAKRVWFPWFRGTYRTFRPPPLHVEDPHPTGGYPDPKVWVWAPFSCLNLGSGVSLTCALNRNFKVVENSPCCRPKTRK